MMVGIDDSGHEKRTAGALLSVRKATVVPDVDRGIDKPVKILIDYMYLHERLGKYRNNEHTTIDHGGPSIGQSMGLQNA